MAKARLVQIYYVDSQKDKCYSFADLHFNASLTVFFENSVIQDVVMASQDEKISVCSWKLRSKMRYYIGQPRELTQSVLESDYDVLAFTRNTKNHRMLAAADAWHPGFLNCLDKILKKIGVPRPGEVKIPIYQNHFSARTDIYKDYVKTYLSPAMEVIKNDTEINELAMRDSKYSDLTHQTAEHLKERLGIAYYPLVPFILERLFSIYVQNKQIRVTPL